MRVQGCSLQPPFSCTVINSSETNQSTVRSKQTDTIAVIRQSVTKAEDLQNRLIEKENNLMNQIKRTQKEDLLSEKTGKYSYFKS